MDKNHSKQSKMKQEQMLEDVSVSLGKQIQGVLEEEEAMKEGKGSITENKASDENVPDSARENESMNTPDSAGENEGKSASDSAGGNEDTFTPDRLETDRPEEEHARTAVRQSEPLETDENLGENLQDTAFGGEGVVADMKPQKKKMSVKKKALIGVLGSVAVIAIAIVLFVNYALNQINYETREDVVFAQPTGTAVPAPTPEPENKEVVNILLLGEESIYDGDGNGRSDAILIATINGEQKSLKLTSMTRDMYVDIPGYSKNKLNAAYHNGGGFLTMDTIEQNFKVDITGYVRVDFTAFETIVDKLGGVEIELTADEADYLNRKNYISNPSYRNVREGSQLLNGNQALGYCRVRYRTASNGERDDFGRTYRQRTVLKAIFDKYKTKNPVEMVRIGTDLLPYVTTNMTKSQLVSYLTMAASFGTTELETMRIPVDNSFDFVKGDCAGVKRDVTVVDFDINNAALQEFIYGIPSGPAIASGSSVTEGGGNTY